MRTQIQKMGNTFVVHIPKTLAEQVHLQQNSTVNISVRDDHLVIDFLEQQERQEKLLTLDALLEGITPENIHQEIDTGDPVGKEVW